MLTSWRQVAELRARLSHEAGRPVQIGPAFTGEIALAAQAITVPSLGEENSLIGEALLRSCLGDLWGPDLAAAVRDFAIELVRNAFQHGGASRATVSIEPRRIVIADDGSPFTCRTLASPTGGQGGGSAATRQLLDRFTDTVLLTDYHGANGNETIVALIRSPEDIMAATPCVVALDAATIRQPFLSLPAMEACGVIYLVITGFLSYSDVVTLLGVLDPERHYILVSAHISTGVIARVEALLPNCRVMRP
jgi:hypothetical protein